MEMCSEWIPAEFGSGSPQRTCCQKVLAPMALAYQTLVRMSAKCGDHNCGAVGLSPKECGQTRNSVGVVAQWATETMWASWMTFTASSFGLRQYVGNWARSHGTGVSRAENLS